MKSIAVMQPYFFPYLGYYQLVSAVDKFVFYDDVNFIKRGWINRNRILINDEPQYFTIELVKASQNRLINEIKIGSNISKVLKTISLTYKRAPFYEQVFPLVERCLSESSDNIGELSMRSVTSISKYLGLKTKFEESSQVYADTFGMDRADRLIAICKKNSAEHYINALGGTELYSKDYFGEHLIQLSFLKPNLKPYSQFKDGFVAGLSMLDVIMFNDITTVNRMLDDYVLQ